MGACVRDKPDLYTTFLFDSVWTWVQTIVSDAEGQPGPIGSGIGRVEFSSCEHFGSNVPIAPINSGLAVSLDDDKKIINSTLQIYPLCNDFFLRIGRLDAFVGDLLTGILG